MPVSFYDMSIPVMTHALKNLSALLDKAEAHAEAKKIDPKVLPQARLIADMFALSRQVQIACDISKGAAGRLAGIEIPKHRGIPRRRWANSRRGSQRQSISSVR